MNFDLRMPNLISTSGHNSIIGRVRYRPMMQKFRYFEIVFTAIIAGRQSKIVHVAGRLHKRNEAVGLVLHLEHEVEDQVAEIAVDDILPRGVEQLLKSRPKSNPPGFTEIGRRKSNQEKVDGKVEEVRRPIDEPIDDILNIRVVQEAIRPSCSKTPAALTAKPYDQLVDEWAIRYVLGAKPSALPPAGGRRQQTT